MKKREPFICLKDHQKNFDNPAKSDFEKINKFIWDKVNTNIGSILNVNQWRNGKMRKHFKAFKTSVLFQEIVKDDNAY